jgi:O-antigen/teichoic acid export membrane protein
MNLLLIPNLGAFGAAISQMIASSVEMVYYTYLVMIKIRIYNFIPFKKLGKYLGASLFMGSIVATSTYFLGSEMSLQLITGLAIGPPTYAIALRLVGAFDQTDKRILMNSKIPFKSIISRLLWRG